MFKKFSISIICVAMLLSLAACNKDDAHQNGGTTKQTQSASATDAFQPSSPTEAPSSPTEAPSSPTEAPSKPIEDTSTPTEEKKAVFHTEDIIRITFYAYYGGGKGSDVPAENVNEILTWLDSFEVDTSREFPEVVPPGTNTIWVEIEYSDGRIVKQGMDTTEINGVTYYICSDPAPECYDEIITKTSLY